ncbi:MAG: hypothetical protein AB7R89_11790 [Dehalococcoidia bacterium]
MRAKSEPRRAVIYSIDEVPPFTTEAEEQAFWATHEVSDELAAQAEPLPADIVALLDRIRENRKQRKAASAAAIDSGEASSIRRR